MREANEAPCLKGEFPKQQEILKEHQSSPREHTNRAAAAWARPDADGWTESKTKGWKKKKKAGKKRNNNKKTNTTVKEVKIPGLSDVTN